MTDKPINTGFLPVFEQKLDKLINKIKDEYKKPREERNKANLKNMAREAKSLRNIVREMQAEIGSEVCCPQCGHKFTA